MVRAVVGILAATLLLTGCEDSQQRSARLALQAYLRALPGDGYRVDATQCSSSPRLGYFNVVASARFVCAGHRTDGLCDWFSVTLRRRGAAHVALLRRDAGCVLPPG